MVGSRKGVIHLAAAALINAVWDLYARIEQKPLWQLLSTLSPEQVVRAVDFTYIDDVITPKEAEQLLKQRAVGKEARLQQLEKY